MRNKTSFPKGEDSREGDIKGIYYNRTALNMIGPATELEEAWDLVKTILAKRAHDLEQWINEYKNQKHYRAAEDLEIQFVDLCQAIQTIEEVLRS